MPDGPDGNIGPSFTAQELQRIREMLEEAGIKPMDHFKIPNVPDPNQPPGWFINPNVPRTNGVWENYNGQKGDGTFKIDTTRGGPGCDNPFTIRISEVWTPPPAGLAGKFELWANFATVRAILMCLRNEKCRRVVPLGCSHATDKNNADGTCLARANFVFVCVET